jgi:chromosome segregation ATPase
VYASWRETRLALQVEATKADKDYRNALRELEATPAGMQALEEAIAIVGEDSPEGQEMTQRLDDARALRSFQNGELRASRAYQERLAYLSAGERAALDQSEAAVDAARQRLADAETSLWAALTRSQEFTSADRAASQTQQQAEAALAAATAAAEETRDRVRAQLVGLYTAAGVSERMAEFYATDTLVAATRPTGAPWRRNEEPELLMRRTPVLKTKPSGPDAERTLMARVASETNSEYALALSQWHHAGERVSAAREQVQEASARITGPTEERRAARNALRVAQVEHQEATAGVTKAEDGHRDLHARIGSGLSTLPVSEVRMEHAGDQFMRNPDGTTNTYVYQPPSDGFEHGRYVRVGGVTSAHGMGEVNALVLDTGEKAVLSGHYGRSGGGFARETRGGVAVAYTVPAQDGAVPLRAENRADRGFYAFVDSTD